MSIGLLHLAGAGLAALTLLGSHHFTRSRVRALAAVLVVATLIYVAFAVVGRAGPEALALELVGTVVFVSLAWTGTRFSLWWLVAGWALHAGWDFGLHLFGPAAGTAPEWYSHFCFSFDLVMATYFAVQLLRRRANNSSKPTPLRGAA